MTLPWFLQVQDLKFIIQSAALPSAGAAVTDQSSQNEAVVGPHLDSDPYLWNFPCVCVHVKLACTHTPLLKCHSDTKVSIKYTFEVERAGNLGE